MNETVDVLWDKFLKRKETYECKGLKINLGKAVVMVNGSITEYGMSKSKVDPCGNAA